VIVKKITKRGYAPTHKTPNNTWVHVFRKWGQYYVLNNGVPDQDLALELNEDPGALSKWKIV